MKNPIGHGAGQSGAFMGYGAGDFIAIDSYYISLALDYGVIGLVVYVAIFVIVIAAAIDTMLRFGRSNDRELTMLIPIASCLTAFLMIRGVFAQPDIHPMIFTILGMGITLVARARRETAAASPPPRLRSQPRLKKKLFSPAS